MFSSSATLAKKAVADLQHDAHAVAGLALGVLAGAVLKRSTMDSASLTVWWLLRPLMSTTAPMPQASVLELGVIVGPEALFAP